MTWRFAALFALLQFTALPACAQKSAMDQGLELFRQGSYEAALEHFRSAQKLEPVSAAIENLIGITETKLGGTDAAAA